MFSNSGDPTNDGALVEWLDLISRKLGWWRWKGRKGDWCGD